jgi:hypothetical protein
VKAQLDRALANEALLLLYLEYRGQHLSSVQSDHCFVLTLLQKQATLKMQNSQHVFWYENVWQTHKDYDTVISNMWNSTAKGQGQEGFASALQQMETNLSSWGNNTFGNFKNRLSVLRKALERARRASVHSGPSPEERKIFEKINEVLDQEEVWIRQRSRVM